jgi:hypothetical protein
VIGGFDGRAPGCQRVRMNLVCDQHEATQPSGTPYYRRVAHHSGTLLYSSLVKRDAITVNAYRLGTQRNRREYLFCYIRVHQ